MMYNLLFAVIFHTVQDFRKQEIISDIILRVAFLGCWSRLGIALGLGPRAVLGCSSEPRSWLCGGGYLLHILSCSDAMQQLLQSHPPLTLGLQHWLGI